MLPSRRNAAMQVGVMRSVAPLHVWDVTGFVHPRSMMTPCMLDSRQGELQSARIVMDLIVELQVRDA